MGKYDNMKKREKRRGTHPLIILLFNILLLIILFSGCVLLFYFLGNHLSNSAYQDLSDSYTTEAESGDASGDAANEWWGEVVIDFESLWEINSDIAAWIRFDDTDAVPIDYPILYNGDNDAYIRTDIYGNYATEGCLFIEENNAGDLSDMNTIIYGHAMRNGHMFGSLKYYRLDDTFIEENAYFTIYLPGKAYRYRIFSYFTTEYDSDVYQIGFASGSSYYEAYLDYIVSNSSVDCGYVPDADDPIVILSTCATGYGTDTQRFVVFAARIGIAATDN